MSEAHMSQPLCLANARLVLTDRIATGSITAEDGVITEIDETSRLPAGAVDCGGDFVMPGLIELHTDNLERHIQPRPKVAWPHRSAILAHDGELASAGITTVFDAMRVGSNIASDGPDYAEYARELATELLELKAEDTLKISHFIHLRAEVCSDTLIDELNKFGTEDRVRIVSLMDHTPGQRQFSDLSKLKDYVCGKHGMSEAAFADHVAERLALREKVGAAHEAATVEAAKRYGAVLASHDDTTTDQVAVSAQHGVNFAEFPTSVEAAEACRASGIAIMMGAPNIVRGGSHSGNVAALDLAKHDLLDIVSSDYVPSALLLSAFMLADAWDDLPRAVATVTRAPADVSGLPDRGRLEMGARADLLRIRRAGATPVVRGAWVRGGQVA